jgi:hypothetical protein
MPASDPADRHLIAQQRTSLKRWSRESGRAPTSQKLSIDMLSPTLRWSTC